MTIHPSAVGLVGDRLFAGEMATLAIIRNVAAVEAAKAQAAARDLLRLIDEDLH